MTPLSVLPSRRPSLVILFLAIPANQHRAIQWFGATAWASTDPFLTVVTSPPTCCARLLPQSWQGYPSMRCTVRKGKRVLTGWRGPTGSAGEAAERFTFAGPRAGEAWAIEGGVTAAGAGAALRFGRYRGGAPNPCRGRNCAVPERGRARLGLYTGAPGRMRGRNRAVPVPTGAIFGRYSGGAARGIWTGLGADGLWGAGIRFCSGRDSHSISNRDRPKRKTPKALRSTEWHPICYHIL